MMDELEQARETITRLNRRCQDAECALADAIRCNEKLSNGAAWVGGSFGRALLAYGNRLLRERMVSIVDSLNSGEIERAKLLAIEGTK